MDQNAWHPKPVRAVEEEQSNLSDRRSVRALRPADTLATGLLVNNMPAPLLVVRDDGRVILANRAWTEATGLPSDEPFELFDEAVVHGEDARRLRGFWQEAVRADAPFAVECRIRHRGGEERWCELRGTPLRPARRPQLFIISVIDVHAYKSASRQRDEFLATVTHELRAPLTAILGWCNMLRGGLLEGEKASRALDTIARNAEMQSRLIGDLLDASRIAAGKLRVQVEPLSFRRVVAEALDMVRPTAEARSVALSLDAPAEDELRMRGDPARMQQVVGNLVSNAVKFTPPGGSVRVRLARESDAARVSVMDDGQGLAPELLPHVFEPFRQGNAARGRRQDGLGLGLAIVKRLVELHGGTVSAESEGPGKGATFTVRVPLSGPPPNDVAAPLTAPPPADASSTLLKGVRVLLVDDSPDHRELVHVGLSAMGASVRTASDAAEALASLSEERPDVIVSDIGMPDGDGYTLIRRVRALPRDSGGDIPAIALTGYARSEDRRRAYAEGFQLHVAKPVDLETLASLVAGLAS